MDYFKYFTSEKLNSIRKNFTKCNDGSPLSRTISMPSINTSADFAQIGQSNGQSRKRKNHNDDEDFEYSMTSRSKESMPQSYKYKQSNLEDNFTTHLPRSSSQMNISGKRKQEYFEDNTQLKRARSVLFLR